MKEKIKVTCKECGKVEYVSPSRAKHYVTCSITCMGKYNSKRYGDKVEKVCECCGKTFLVKRSHYNRRRCCSKECHNKLLPKKFKGDGNPNFKGRYMDSDGYLFVSDTRIKKHIKVAMDTLGITQIPKGYNIHHRDCNKLNNAPENLVMLNTSDHIWLHKQYGNAVLNAYMQDKIDINTLISWSNDKLRANKLLPLSIIEQSVVLKQGELLESPETDNQQPSLNSNIHEGSETNNRVLIGNAKDSNVDTSALPEE